MCVYIYIYIYIYVCVCGCKYIRPLRLKQTPAINVNTLFSNVTNLLFHTRALLRCWLRRFGSGCDVCWP